MTDRMARLVAQHAQTSRLLGVDFVPAYRAGQGADAARPGPLPHAESQTFFADRPAQETPRAAAAVEVKPGPHAERAAHAAAPARPAQHITPTTPITPGTPAARDPAAAAARLEAIRKRYDEDAPHRHFITSFTNIVFGEGDPCARLMFIGEAPGEEEDKTGRPFVGRAGQLLNKMITAMGLQREQVYITNVLKTRPPNNATPTQDEARLCSPYLFEQIEAIGPEAIVTLGLPATRLLLDSVESMSRLRGQWHAFRTADGREVPVMPTYHPAFLLRSYTPENRAKVWSDLRLVMDRLGLAAAGPGGSQANA
ncbi:MAG: uracil-DNA glycosylase [Phycisphaerales bacterium]|nr:uracil-DNA glycosylase [Phycisphaerales bacterium]